MSFLLPAAYSLSYLGSLYVHPATRLSLASKAQPERTRNHPAVIKARLLAVSLVSVASLALLPLALRCVDPASATLTGTAQLHRALALAGLDFPSNLRITANLLLYPLALTASLFAGSLYITALGKGLPGQIGWSTRRVWNDLSSLAGIRNLIIGPLTEELVFRSCIIAISNRAGLSKSQIIFLTPLYFGFAHVHHAYETYVAGGSTKQSLKNALLQSTAQLGYTTLFGWYSSFLFMRTGSIIPPILSHVFCNVMGFPPLPWALQAYPDRKLSLWTSYGMGIAVFIYGFWRWTDPTFYGGSIYWP